jgi:hypothetical protein
MNILQRKEENSLARPRKKVVENVPLTEEQVSYMMEFARSTAAQYPNLVTSPFLINKKMQEVSLNPLVPTSEGIEKALANPKDNERNLIGYMESLENSDMILRRLILYLAGSCSFDCDWVCINAKTEEDFESTAYQDDYAKVIEFLDKFNVKAEFKKVLRQMVRKEAYFGQLRNEYKDKYVLQELPEDRCIITGRYPYGLLFDFDMSFFLQAGASLDMFSDKFKEFWREIFDESGMTNYNPAATLDNRTGNYVYWVQTSPEDGFVCFKLFEEIASRIPILAPMLPDVVLKPLYRKLSTNSAIQAAQKILIGQIPLLKGESKSATVKDSFAISADNLAKFLGLLRTGIAQEISLGAAPLENINGIEFSMPDKNILADYTQNTASSSGVNSRLIYGYDKQNIEETRNSISVDEFMMTPVYSMFAEWLNFQINKLTKKFKWKFILSGSEFDTSKRKKLEDATTLADRGIFVPGMFAAAMNIQKQDLERMLLEAKANKWDEKLLMIIPPSQMSGKDSEGGRPPKKSGELGDAGANTQETGANIAKGGSV